MKIRTRSTCGGFTVFDLVTAAFGFVAATVVPAFAVGVLIFFKVGSFAVTDLIFTWVLGSEGGGSSPGVDPGEPFELSATFLINSV